MNAALIGEMRSRAGTHCGSALVIAAYTRVGDAYSALADTLTKPCLVLMVHQLALADRVRRPLSF